MRFTSPIKKTLATLLAGLLLVSTTSATVSALEPHGTGIKMRNWLVNDPDYAFSDAYKTSVWYENFSALSLTENDRNNVLRIAISQLGYHEGDSTEEFHGRNTNGTGNFMEYGRLLVPNWNDNSFDWCACFVNWCLNQAHFDKASSEISCGNWIIELKAMNMWQDAPAYGGTYTPKPADFIFFDWDMNGKWSDHIGLVLYTTETHVYTVEGNTKTNDVALRSYLLDDKQILGYGTPPYNEGSEPTLDFSCANGMPAGAYVVTIPDLPLTDANGENPIETVLLGSQVRLLSVTGEYAQVSYKGKTGYLPKSALCLLTKDWVLTYDANGGQTAPGQTTVPPSESLTITSEVPTRSGDTFLGWTTVLYNRKVDFKPGNPIRLSKDTTLYAVWENHSKQLAKAAASLGLLPEYERPSSIRNSGAILFGTLKSADLLTDVVGTVPSFADDASLGRVLSFPASGTSPICGVTVTYGALCEVLRLTPKTAEGTAYVVLRVKDASNSCMSMKLSVNDQLLSEPVALAEGEDWQYVVFNLKELGIRGDISTIRVEWSGETVASGLLLADLWLTPNEPVKNAILEGKYVYPDMELLNVETTVETESETEPAPVTEPSEDTTAPIMLPFETGSDTDADTETDDESTTVAPTDSGCFSIIRTSAWIGAVLLVCIPAVLVRRRDDGDREM